MIQSTAAPSIANSILTWNKKMYVLQIWFGFGSGCWVCKFKWVLVRGNLFFKKIWNKTGFFFQFNPLNYNFITKLTTSACINYSWGYDHRIDIEPGHCHTHSRFFRTITHVSIRSLLHKSVSIRPFYFTEKLETSCGFLNLEPENKRRSKFLYSAHSSHISLRKWSTSKSALITGRC